MCCTRKARSSKQERLARLLLQQQPRQEAGWAAKAQLLLRALLAVAGAAASGCTLKRSSKLPAPLSASQARSLGCATPLSARGGMRMEHAGVLSKPWALALGAGTMLASEASLCATSAGLRAQMLISAGYSWLGE